MKFSVAIPCYNRLELLRGAFYTVKKQDFSNWELCIFDNASKKDIPNFIKEVNDSRVRYKRSDEFLPVTESWNSAISMATGDYVILIGDDDGLTPKYFSRLIPLIEQFQYPEVIYSPFYQFWHPEVAPWDPKGYVIEIKNGFFFVEAKEPFLLKREHAIAAVEGSLTLHRNFSYNIQAFVFHRSLLEEMQKDGDIFRSPFPDYYMANVAMAKSKSTLIIPDPMCIAGVSKASVGYTIYNGLENKFIEILNTDLSKDSLFQEIKNLILPGTLYDTKYVLSMEYVVRYLSSFIVSKFSYGRYRRLQIYERLLKNQKENKKLLEIDYWDQLIIIEKIWAYFLFILMKIKKYQIFYFRRLINRIFSKLTAHSFNSLVRKCDKKQYKEITEVFDALQEGSLK